SRGSAHTDSATETTSFTSGSSSSTSETWSQNKGWGFSEQTVPFHRLEKRRVVTSITFEGYEEFKTKCIQKVKGMGQMEFFFKPPSSTGLFVAANFIAEPRLRKEREEAALSKVYERQLTAVQDEPLPVKLDERPQGIAKPFPK